MACGRCTVLSATLRGVEAMPVDVEVAVSSGIPAFYVVGMADASVQESRERVRAALKASGFSMPAERIVVNLAPSALRKTGSGFDLPIAIALLIATKQLKPDFAQNRLFVGELSLQGEVRPVDGLLAYALCAKKYGIDLICADAPEKLIAMDGLVQLGLRSLRDLHSQNLVNLVPRSCAPGLTETDFRNIAGNDVAKRALQIAAAGRHGVLMMGPPGSGKTMLASCLPSILPELNEDEILQVALVRSVAGEDITSTLAGTRPFRAPHHSATMAGLVGGGRPIRPGEVSLAHKGVLFLDELAEFKPSVLQGIRQPMESGKVVLTRADGHVSFPADFMLIAASNPCPCGFFGDPDHRCSCSVSQINAYQSRIGGPLLDRIDLHIDVRRISPTTVLTKGQGTSSDTLRKGVEVARKYKAWRSAREDRTKTTAELIHSCHLADEDRIFFEQAAEKAGMSGRSIVRTLSVARTIADMDERLAVGRNDLYEALGLRLREGVGR